MSPANLDVALYEGDSLKPCWKLGGLYSRATGCSQPDRNEIASVDIVSCCKQITELLEENNARRGESRSLANRSRRNVNFNGIARLAFGVTDIYRRQVDMLFDDTKKLLDKINRTNLMLDFTTTESPVSKHSEMRVCRKRKHVITKRSKVTAIKRPRLQEPQLLGHSAQEFYINMLSECQVWQKESTELVVQEFQESIELPRMCTQASSYHAITITEEIQIHEEQSFINPFEGFGEVNEADLSFFEELYPKNKQRDSFSQKQQSICLNDTTDILHPEMSRLDSNLNVLDISNADSAVYPNILPPKMPRLDINTVDLGSSHADNAIMTTIYPINIEPAKKPFLIPEPSLTTFLDTQFSSEIIFSKPKRVRKRKLSIDKCIKYSRDTLIKHREQYMKEHIAREVIIQIPTKQIRSPNELLSNLGRKSVFSDIIKNPIVFDLSKEKMDNEREKTLRTIFGSDFSDNLATQILGQDLPQLALTDSPENVTPPSAVDMVDSIPTLLQPLIGNEENNNITLFKPMTEYGNDYNAHALMMDLLTIFRNNPDIQGIDAKEFIKSFHDRIKASLAFSHMLYLVRDQFIKISKKPNSLEVDQITLGEESIKLIENLTLNESF
ncbi:hypothetical protein KR009_007703 [Drosophila setifemur]|nr:hypothetical protein KR009_007703 [Drosophila setifemur]